MNGNIPATMPLYIEKYNDDQREAMAVAYEDRKIRPASRVVELAKAGELTYRGEKLDPFETNEATVRDLARKLRRQRAGQVRSDLASLPPRDAIDALRIRLINAADAMLREFERSVKRAPGKADPARHRQISDAVLAASKLPGPTDPRPPSHGTRDRETGKKGTETTGGAAGSLIKAHRAGDTAPATHEARPSATQNTTTDVYGEDTATERSTAANAEQNGTQDRSPGSWVREQSETLSEG